MISVIIFFHPQCLAVWSKLEIELPVFTIFTNLQSWIKMLLINYGIKITYYSIILNLGITCNLSKMLVHSSIIIIYVITFE